MSWTVTMLNWKTFHDISWTWWEFWYLMIFHDIFLFLFFGNYSSATIQISSNVIKCLSIEHGDIGWHVMTCHDVANLIQRGRYQDVSLACICFQRTCIKFLLVWQNTLTSKWNTTPIRYLQNPLILSITNSVLNRPDFP